MATTTSDKTVSAHLRARRLQEFLHLCAGSPACEEDDRVREAMTLLGGSGVEATGFLDSKALEAMVASGGATSAVIVLLGRDARFMLSRGAHESCMATVIQPGGADEAVGQARTLALALLSAHLSAVLERIESGRPSIDAVLTRASISLH